MSLVYAIDVSNWQGADIAPLIAQHEPQHVVVRLSTESQRHIDLARQQLATALQAGCTVSGYVWAYWHLSPTEHTEMALSVAHGFPLAMVWFDCEDDPGGRLDDWLSQAVDLAERRGHRCGVYARKSWWLANGDSRGFTRLPLWVAQYDGIPELDIVGLFGGWQRAAGKQWSDSPIDRDVFDPAVLAPDPTQKLREGITAALAQLDATRARLAELLT